MRIAYCLVCSFMLKHVLLKEPFGCSAVRSARYQSCYSFPIGVCEFGNCDLCDKQGVSMCRTSRLDVFFVFSTIRIKLQGRESQEIRVSERLRRARLAPTITPQSKLQRSLFLLRLMRMLSKAPDVYLQDFMHYTAAKLLADWIIVIIHRFTGS